LKGSVNREPTFVYKEALAYGMGQYTVNEHIPNEVITMFGLSEGTKITILTDPT